MTLLCLAGSLAVLLLGVLALFITFWVIYVGVYIAVNWLVPHSHDTRWWVSLGLLVLVFVVSLVTDHRRLEHDLLSSAAEDYDPFKFELARALGHSELAISPKTWMYFITYFLCAGPRLVVQSTRLIRQALLQGTFDAEGCAAVLRLLARKDERLSYDDTDEAIPAGHERKVVYRHLRSLQGVIFLKSEPRGLSLTSEFRKQLRALKPKKGGE